MSKNFRFSFSCIEFKGKMKHFLIFFTVSFLIQNSERVSGQELQCSSNAKPDTWISSDAEFWKGINGAEFITALDNNSHDVFTKQNSKAFVMYYATWCGYSQNSRSGFAGAAKELNGKVSFGAVDCQKERIACQGSHPVDGYPTFYFYKGGQWIEEYNRQRTTQAFVNYLNRK